MKTKIVKKVVKKKEKTSTIPSEGKGIILFALLAILLFYPPFFRGLFFQREILITHIFSFGLFTIYLVNKITQEEKIHFNSPFDYIPILFIIAYLLPIFFRQWADLRDAIGITLRYTNFLIVYLMVKDYATEKKYKLWILDIFIISGGITAIIGLLGLAGYVNLQDVVLGNRVASTFQYPNTLAAFLMTLFFIVIARQKLEEKLWKKSLYASLGFLFLFTFILTYSRAAWALFPIFALGYLLIVPADFKLNVLLYYIVTGVVSLLFLQPFSSYTTNLESSSVKALFTIIIALSLFNGLYIGIEKFKDKLHIKDTKKIYLILSSLVIIGALLIGLALNITKPLVFDNTHLTENKSNSLQRVVRNIKANQNYLLQLDLEAQGGEENQWPWRVRIFAIDSKGTREPLLTKNGEPQEKGSILIPFSTHADTQRLALYFDNLYAGTKVTFHQAKILTENEEIVKNLKLKYTFIPENIINRLNTINLAEESFTTRIAYYRDSFKIFRDYPLIGKGGGAWKALYPRYQSENYFSTEAHNYFLQTLVELGLVGMVLMAVFLLTVLLAFIRAVKKGEILQITIIFAVLSLLAHSALDFNFSYLSIPLFMWGLIGILDLPSEGLDISPKGKLQKQMSPFIPLVLILPFMVASLSFYGGQQSAIGAVKILQEGRDFQKGYELLESAVRRDPFHKDFRIDLAQLQRIIGEENQEKIWFQMAEENLKKAEKYAPYNDGVFHHMASLYISYGDFDRAFEYLQKLIEAAPLRAGSYETKASFYKAVGDYYFNLGEKEKAIEIYQKTLETIQDIKTANLAAQRPITLTKETLQTIFTTRYILENIENDGKLSKLDNIIYISYLDIDVDKDGKIDERGWWTWNSEGGNIQVEVGEKGAIIANKGDNLALLLSPVIELEASKTYTIELELEGNTLKDVFALVIYSRSGTATQLTQRPIGQATEANTYSFTFQTTDDIEKGGQDIRFYHYGNSDDMLVVRRVVVFEE